MTTGVPRGTVPAEHGAGRGLRPAGVLRGRGQAPAEVGPADVLGFITAQRTGRSDGRGCNRSSDEAGGVATSTVARRLSIISGFFAYLQARGDIDANPVPRGLPTRRERLRPGQGVPLTRRARRLPRILTPAEVDALTAALRTHRDRAMVAAMVFGGLRRCEVLGLRLEDLRVAERRVFIAEGKGGHQRLVPVSIAVLRRGRRLPGGRAAAGCGHRPGVRGPQRAHPRTAVVGPGAGRGTRRRQASRRAEPCDLPRAAAHLPDPAPGGRDGTGGGPGPGRARLDRVHPDLPAPGR